MSGQNAQKHMVFLLNNGSNEQISSDTRELECLTLPHPKGEHVWYALAKRECERESTQARSGL